MMAELQGCLEALSFALRASNVYVVGLHTHLVVVEAHMSSKS